MGSKTVATLGVLVAINSVLRFVEVAIPGPGGFTPTFAPIILAGYVFGARFGFLFGAFTFFASALITGGVGPWLPYQMTAAGWMGMSAGLLGLLLPAAPRRRRRETWLLGAFGFVWGFLYGAIMNLYSWPLAAGPADQYWTPGIGLSDTIGRYAVFYAATSLWWDFAGALGNVALILALGAPLIGAFVRFRRRLEVRVEPA
jgi:energy-coupling factor transport system substrate-specific component